MFNSFYPHVMQLAHDLDYVYDRVSLYLEPGDVLLVISIWPCTKKTIDVAQMCHDRGISIALITNTSLNPITKFSKVPLFFFVSTLSKRRYDLSEYARSAQYFR